MTITPSILTDSLTVAQEQLNLVAAQSPFKRVQIDIVDPEFADEVTIHPIDILDLDVKGLEIDIHLMTNDPINDVIECSQIPGIKTIIAQIEHMDDQQAFVDHVHSFAIDAGFSLDIGTPVESINVDQFARLSVVQVMANRAGVQGESFLKEQTLEKIKELTELKRELGYTFEIFVDIGMNPETIKECVSVGATGFAPGSFLWKSPDFSEAVEALTHTS